WGDGSTSDGTISGSGGQGTVTASHTYLQAGTYTIRIRVIDNAGDGSDRLVTAVIGSSVTSSISGYVYLDSNLNGHRDANEIGMPNIPITLDGPVSQTLTTDEDGFYIFDRLPPGTYSITQTQPQAYYDGLASQGTPELGSVESNRFYGLELPADVHATDYNFGESGLLIELISKRLLLTIPPPADLLDSETVIEDHHWYSFFVATDGIVSVSLPADVLDPMIELYTWRMVPLVIAHGQHQLSHAVQQDEQFMLHVAGQPIDPPFQATLRLSESSQDDPPDYRTNPQHALDVNGDGIVSALDALILINELNQLSRGESTTVSSAEYFLDVDGDGWLTPTDVLLVLNHLNAVGPVRLSASDALLASSSAGEAAATGADEGQQDGLDADNDESTTVFWAYDGDGWWDEADKWSSGVVPGPEDAVVIDAGSDSVTVTVRPWSTASVKSLQMHEHLVLSNGATLQVSSESEVAGNLRILGGTLAGSGAIRVTGHLDWLGGWMQGSGTTIIESGGTAQLTGSDSNRLELRRGWINRGTTVWNSGDLQVDSTGWIDNHHGALFDVRTANRLGADYDELSGWFHNWGEFRKSSPAGFTVVSVAFHNDNSGHLQLDSGTVEFWQDLRNSGTVTIDQSATLRVSDFYGGELGQVSRYYQSDGHTQLLGGTLLVIGILELDGGVLSGYGTIQGDVHQSGEIRPGSPSEPLRVTGDFVQTASALLTFDLTGVNRPLRISGDVHLAGDLQWLDSDAAPLRAEFILLENQGRQAIAGSMDSWPEGTSLVVGGEPHVLTYAGGSGNDLAIRFPLAVTIDDAWVVEGDRGTTVMAFPVTLPRTLSQDVWIGYETQDGTAIAPYDYLPAEGSIRIPAGETQGWIEVLVVGDTAPAADEQFFVHLTDVGAHLDSNARRTAVGTIRNDDNDRFRQTGQFVFTSTADFHEGRMSNVTALAVPDQLRLDPADLGMFPFVNVPVSNRGTVIRIDVRTGQVVGEYITAPGWIAGLNETDPDEMDWYDPEPYEFAMGRDPSRTTVDLMGNVWVANRAESSEIDGVRMGSVTRIGVVVGGTRGNKVSLDGSPWEEGQPWKFQPDPDGQYLQGPFQYSTAVDRDGDGLIRTSRGLEDVLSWSNADGVDSHGGVSTADDELITVYTRTLATGARTVAIDRNNDAWVGGTNTWHELLSGQTGLPIEDMAFNLNAGGYGGLVDGDDVLWSTLFGDGLLRFVPDRNDPPGVGQVLGNATGDYGIGLDPNTGHLWHASYNSGRLYELDAQGNLLNWFQKPQQMQHLGLKGVSVDHRGHVWVVGAGDGSCQVDERIWHLAPDPASTPDNPLKHVTVGVVGGFCGIHGAAVDGFGKVWVPEGGRVTRIDPQAGERRVFGDHEIPLGEVDLRVDIGPNAAPYTYSDMTGFVSWNAFAQGTWTHTVDAEHLDALWYSVSTQTVTPEGSSIELRVRASNDRATLDLLPYVQIESDQVLQDVTGRYFQVQVTLRSSSWDVVPALEELVIECLSVGPSIQVESPTDNSRFATGTEVLITGLAAGGHRTVPLATVMIDGAPVDALDAAGRFFTQVMVAPGQNSFQLTAVDVAGRTAITDLILVGVPEEPSLVSWTSMTDLTEFVTAYQRTSFHDRQHVLYADLTLTNSGPYALEGPLYLGITNISHPSVQAFGAS
ncbi:MAG: hypothetical protein EA424_09215, partial [Planctomycetaceae bacterium]